MTKSRRVTINVNNDVDIRKLDSSNLLFTKVVSNPNYLDIFVFSKVIDLA